MDHGVPREHPSIIRIWGENSLKYAGEHQNLVSFPPLFSLSPAQGYLARIFCIISKGVFWPTLPDLAEVLCSLP